MRTTTTKKAIKTVKTMTVNTSNHMRARLATPSMAGATSVAVITVGITTGMLISQSASAMTLCSTTAGKISATPVTLITKRKKHPVYVCQNKVDDNQLSRDFLATDLVDGGSQAIGMGKVSKQVDLSTTNLTIDGLGIPELDMKNISQSFPRNNSQNLFTFYQFHHKNKKPSEKKCSQGGNSLLNTLKANPKIFFSGAVDSKQATSATRGGGNHIANIKDVPLMSQNGRQSLSADVLVLSTGYGKVVTGDLVLPNEHANYHAAKQGYFCSLGVKIKMSINPNDNLKSAATYNTTIGVRQR